MRKIYRVLTALFFLAGLSQHVFAQQSFFSAVNENTAKANVTGVRVITPQKFSMQKLDVQQIKTFLWHLPSDKHSINPAATPVMEIPMPDGSMARFHVWESSIQEPGLEAKFPEIKTFAGQGIDDPTASIRFDYTDFGFHAQILSPHGRVYVDPYSRGDINYYQTYYSRDEPRYFPWKCETTATSNFTANPGQTNVVPVGPCRGTMLYTYRLAVACTGEYAVAVGGTTAALLHSAIVTTVNRVTGVYQTDLTVKLVLVANNNVIEYLNASTDPFNGNNNANTLIGESQTVIDANIGTANYDVGHTFSTGGGGLAGLGVVCRFGQKARGITGSPTPTGDGYDIDYVAHEMGHEFGGDHSFNSTMSNCGGGNRNGATAYEVGSGTSIMAYAGICGPAATTGDNIQAHSDPYFHPVSFDEISTYLSGTGGTCGVQTATGNNIPVITSMSNNGVSIPINTPFTLTGTATDADGDAITYDWEEWDLGPATVWNGGNANTTSPLFKSRNPVTSGSRTFPDISVILAGYPANPAGTMDGLKGETLPTVARAMMFRLEVRDNRAAGGGIVTGGNGCGTFGGVFQINTVATTGPFAVTVPNGGETYTGGSTQTVTWNVVGTTAAPISVANVKISYSTDGGLTYPTVLLASTANDGSEPVTIPAGGTTTARIKVEAVGNIFFDISDANFTVTTPANDFAFGTPTTSTTTCPSGTATVTIPTTVIGTFATPITLAATAGVPAGTTVTFVPNPLTPGASSVATLNNANTLVAGTYNITVTGTAGAQVHTTTITYIIAAGAGPAITTQPAAQTVCAPAAASFTVASSTGGVTYQWQSAPTISGTYTNIAGATSATYNTGATTAAMNGMGFHVIVSTQCGSTTSNNALLTVNSAAAITTQPTNQSACTGNAATFTVAGSGTGVTYQWQSATAAGGPYTPIAGATSATYTIPSVTGATPGFYNVVLTTTLCAGTVTSNNVTLTINTTTAVTTQPANQTVCAPAAATFTVVAAGSGNTYQWQVSTAAVPAYTNIAGATSATYNTGATTAAMSGNAYHVVITGTCNTVTSNNVTLTVNTAAAITGQPVDVTVCNGTAASFTVTATGTGATYQWQSATAVGGPYSNIAGATSATYTIGSTTPAMNNTYYQAVVTTTACAGTVTSSAAHLTVNTVANITTQPTSQSACVPNAATFTVAATGTGLTYQWQVSTDGGTTFTNIAGATSATYTITPTAFSQNGNKYRVQILSTCSPTTPTTSNVVTLTVNNPVSVTQNPQNQRGCAGDNFTFSVTAVSSGSVTYQWQVSTDGGATYNNVSTGGTASTYTITNAPITLNGTKYRVIVSGVPCGVVTTPGASLTLGYHPAVILAAQHWSTIDPSHPTVLTATVSPSVSTGNIILTWTHNGAVIPNTQTTTQIPITVDDFGTYQVTATDATTTCSTTSNIVVIDSVVSQHLFIYPNPVHNMMQVRYYSSTPASRGTMLDIYDSRGARVYAKEYTVTGTYGRMDVDMTGMPVGNYVVELRDASGRKLASATVVKSP